MKWVKRVKVNGIVRKVWLYNIWCHMRGRCKSPSSPDYPTWGGRGISVCSEWDDYAIFRQWAIANGYKKGLTIDRKDSNGNYEPNNCRWLTRSEHGKIQTPHGKKGTEHHLAKLTEQDVKTIRTSNKPATHMAEKYGVSKWTIFDVRKRRTWAHI